MSLNAELHSYSFHTAKNSVSLVKSREILRKLGEIFSEHSERNSQAFMRFNLDSFLKRETRTITVALGLGLTPASVYYKENIILNSPSYQIVFEVIPPFTWYHYFIQTDASKKSELSWSFVCARHMLHFVTRLIHNIEDSPIPIGDFMLFTDPNLKNFRNYLLVDYQHLYELYNHNRPLQGTGLLSPSNDDPVFKNPAVLSPDSYTPVQDYLDEIQLGEIDDYIQNLEDYISVVRDNDDFGYYTEITSLYHSRQGSDMDIPF